jgi:hypothetical protein
MHKGHYGHYTGNARHSKVTDSNMGATKRDDEAHMKYLKEDIDYDNKHDYSDSSMTSDEKHISKLAGDLKYDEKKHGSPAKVIGDRKAHKQSESEYQSHLQSPKGKEEHGSAAKMVSPLNIEGGIDKHGHIMNDTKTGPNPKGGISNAERWARHQKGAEHHGGKPGGDKKGK